MARTFIPCVYHEFERDDLMEGVIHTRYNALELFDLCRLADREPDVLITRDSHQYHVTTAQTEQERLQGPSTRDQAAQWAREQLFRTFYEELAR
jgi:hypothetical protein